jgi:hypothetical protein
LGGAATPYLVAAEVPNNAVREKTASLGAALNVVWAFITNFVLPYMLAALSFKVGYIFGGIALSAVVWTFFFLPETKVSAGCIGLFLYSAESRAGHLLVQCRRYKVVQHREKGSGEILHTVLVR